MRTVSRVYGETELGDSVKRDSMDGGALIAGSVASMVTMLLHPTGRDVAASAGAARLSVFAHGLAIAGAVLLLFGALGLTRRLKAENGLADLGGIAYALGIFAIVIAAAASGFIATELLRQLADTDGAERDAIRTMVHYTGMLNQAFAKISAVAMSAGIGLWSSALWRAPGGAKALGAYGGAAALLIIGGVLSGLLPLNIHGEGLVFLLQAVWMVWAAVLVMRGKLTT